jgi:hypothetical protein
MPVKQAFREVYLITPAELETRLYSSIVSASSRPKVMLPFGGDGILSIIVSKAILLAADDKITDRAITWQLRAR